MKRYRCYCLDNSSEAFAEMTYAHTLRKAAERYAKSLYGADFIQGSVTIMVKQVSRPLSKWFAFDVTVVKTIVFNAKKVVRK